MPGVNDRVRLGKQWLWLQKCNRRNTCSKYSVSGPYESQNLGCGIVLQDVTMKGILVMDICNLTILFLITP